MFVSIRFERKEPKRKITMKRNPYLDDKEGEPLEQNKRLSIKRLRREHRKNIKQGLEEK